MAERKKRRGDTLSKVLKVLVLLVFGLPGVLGLCYLISGIYYVLTYNGF